VELKNSGSYEITVCTGILPAAAAGVTVGCTGRKDTGRQVSKRGGMDMENTQIKLPVSDKVQWWAFLNLLMNLHVP
jgi:hypothetical protein